MESLGFAFIPEHTAYNQLKQWMIYNVESIFPIESNAQIRETTRCQESNGAHSKQKANRSVNSCCCNETNYPIIFSLSHEHED